MESNPGYQLTGEDITTCFPQHGVF